MDVNHNRSEAYDLSLFEPKKPKLVALEPNKKAQKAELKHHRVQSFLNTVTVLVTLAFIGGIIALTLTNRAQLTEMNRQLAVKQEQLQSLQDEYKSVANDLASKTSTQEVEKYASENLGMQKMEPGQVQYITVNGADKAEAAGETTKNWFQKTLDRIGDFFSNLAYRFQ